MTIEKGRKWTGGSRGRSYLERYAAYRKKKERKEGRKEKRKK